MEPCIGLGRGGSHRLCEDCTETAIRRKRITCDGTCGNIALTGGEHHRLRDNQAEARIIRIRLVERTGPAASSPRGRFASSQIQMTSTRNAPLGSIIRAAQGRIR
jgi:hypothetical protein